MQTQLMWGIQPALYLFLGGMGAGAFLAAGALYLRDRATSKTLLAASMWASLICVGVGLLLLLSELAFPLRGLVMWQSFSHSTSWMTYGAWLAFGAMVLFFAGALLTTKQTSAFLICYVPLLKKKGERVLLVVVIVGMAFAAGVAVYTGMLLMSAPGIAFWNTALLPCLFTVSALDTGVALVELLVLATARAGGLNAAAERFLRRGVVALVCVEAVVAALFLATSAGASPSASYSASVLLTGAFAPVFWAVFAGAGLGLPLVAALVGLKSEKLSAKEETQGEGASAALSGEGVGAPAAGVAASSGRDELAAATPAATSAAASAAASVAAQRPCRVSAAVTVVGALGALAGGCALRFLVLFAGAHADLVATTLACLPL